MTGPFRVKLPLGEHYLPFLGSVAMEHAIITCHEWEDLWKKGYRKWN